MRHLLPLAVVLLLGACANRFEVMSPQPVAGLSPLELPGREVLSAIGREVGRVEDVVLGMNGRPEQLIVSIGAPMTMVRRHVAVGVDEGRLSVPQNAVVLNGDLAPEQVASRPNVAWEAGMVALSRAVAGLGNEPTNWYRATEPVGK